MVLNRSMTMFYNATGNTDVLIINKKKTLDYSVTLRK